MKKKLISAENISSYLAAGANEIYVDTSMILTAGAKDYLRQKKVKLVYSKQAAAPQTPCQKANTANAIDLKNIVTRIVSILKNEYQVSDADKVERVTQRVLRGLQR